MRGLEIFGEGGSKLSGHVSKGPLCSCDMAQPAQVDLWMLESTAMRLGATCCKRWFVGAVLTVWLAPRVLDRAWT